MSKQSNTKGTMMPSSLNLIAVALILLGISACSNVKLVPAELPSFPRFLVEPLPPLMQMELDAASNTGHNASP
jgi:hypothetical protein